MHADRIRPQASLRTPARSTWAVECLAIAQGASYRILHHDGSSRTPKTSNTTAHCTGSACGDFKLRYRVWNLDL